VDGNGKEMSEGRGKKRKYEKKSVSFQKKN